MFNWFMENWITITAVVGGLYIAVSAAEYFVTKRKNKEIVESEK